MQFKLHVNNVFAMFKKQQRGPIWVKASVWGRSFPHTHFLIKTETFEMLLDLS